MKTTAAIGVTLVWIVMLVCSDIDIVMAQQGSGANSIMPWAYTLNAPADPDATRPDPDEVVRVAGAP